MTEQVVILRQSSQVVLVPAEPTAPVVQQQGAGYVILQQHGIPGLRGADGTGSGGEAEPYRHTQSSPSTEWIVNHNLGFFPGSVSVLNTAGQIIDVEVRHMSSNQLRVLPDSPLTGSVVVSP